MNLLNNHHYIKNNFEINNKKTADINDKNNEVKGSSFNEILTQKAELQNKISFSKHANMRINDRSINLTSNQMDRVEAGVNKAREKGVKDSLVLVDNLALVVNVKNNVVITAVDSNDKVFTNIDGTVIV